MRAPIFVYIIEEVAHAHAQTHLEWFSSTTVLGVVLRLLSKIYWLRISLSTFVTDIGMNNEFTKYLKESSVLGFDEHYSLRHFLEWSNL